MTIHQPGDSGRSSQDAQKAYIFKCWNEGQSAREIAEKVGRSRGSVIGLVHRAGLTRSKSGAKETARLGYIDDRSRVRRATKPEAAPAAPKALPVPRSVSAEWKPLGVALLDLGRNACRWPLDGGLYCGLPTEFRKSYCPRCDRASRAGGK